jgi:ribosomal protein L24
MKELLPGVYSAAYTCAPDCGAIFVEGQMNPQLNRYLTLVPGLKTRHRQPIVTFVPPEDRPRTLQIPSTRGPRLCIGQWIHISRGTYKNDIGCIKELNDSGRACVLVIPRLRPPSYSSKAGKRSRLASTPLPEPTLFDPVVIQNIFGIVPTPVNSNTFLFGGQTFEYGLLAKEINTTSISSTATTIHCQAAALFLRSKHPFIMAARFPSPAEWNFITNDLVEIDRGSSVGKLGRIRVVQPDSLEIELTDTKERILCSWYDVRKWILKGEFVKVAGGTDIGRTGFVTETNPTEICVLEGGGDGSQAVQVNIIIVS